MNRTARTQPPDGGWIDRSLYPFTDRYADAGGCRVHYVDEGAGAVLLLLHGNPTWSFLYREVIKRLAGEYRCIAPDYPGFGLSTAPAGYGFTPAEHAAVIEEFVLGLDLTGVTVMGQDWGGPIGLAVAARHPERFARIVLGNTWAWPADGERFFRLFAGFFGSPAGGWAIGRHNAFVEWMIPFGTTGKVPAKVLDHYRRPFADPADRLPTRVFPREIVASRGFLEEVEQGLQALAEKPALLVWGDKDRAFVERHRQRLAAAFPDHWSVRLRGAGHFIQEDAPGRIVDAIREWTDRAAQAKGRGKRA